MVRAAVWELARMDLTRSISTRTMNVTAREGRSGKFLAAAGLTALLAYLKPADRTHQGNRRNALWWKRVPGTLSGIQIRQLVKRRGCYVGLV